MRLADFIDANIEAILMQWEDFARSLWRGSPTDPSTLRDHAENILRAAAVDMRAGQTSAQQSDKGKGIGAEGPASDDVDAASDLHAADRLGSGFQLSELVAEYRALRASVLRLWRQSEPIPDLRDVDDLTRFNESIDQSLTQAIAGYASRAERTQSLLGTEQAARMGAEAANRAKDVFLATLSHEMRTPLNAIVGWANVLGLRGCTPDNLQQGVMAIQRQAAAQAKLIDDVMDVSRIVSGKMRLAVVASDLGFPIGAAIDATRAAADAKGISLTVNLDDAARSAAVDIDRIQQVVWNLVSNAVKFTPTGGHVRVTLSLDGSDRVIHVVDNGIGIEQQFLPHVFERFRQADDSARRHFNGLGLGLSIVKHLVELHGGRVEAASAGAGLGSVFTVRLPMLAPAGQKRGEAAAATTIFNQERVDVRIKPVALTGLRILLVDDDADARYTVALLLEAAGAVVTVAGSAAEAMEVLTRRAPAVDVLVSDLGMPGEDGFDLIKRVRASGHRARDLPAVALTAFVGSDAQRRALEAGYQAHLPKPVDPGALAATIESLARLTASTHRAAQRPSS